MRMTGHLIAAMSLVLLCASTQTSLAQNSATVFATGSFTPPVATPVAPGEIITVYAAGLLPTALPANADRLPLPTLLGGISASIEQFARMVADVPLLSVFAVSTCPDPSDVSASCGTLTGIRLQVPYETVPYIPGRFDVVTDVRLFVKDQAGHSTAIDLRPVLDHIHLLTEQDTNPLLLPTKNDVISPLVTHSDGTLVNAEKPAKAGEHLVAYALGLGPTEPRVSTGQPSPSPAPRVTQFLINYAFSPNALVSRGLIPRFFSSPDVAKFPAPSFAGLSPGSVGLYQLNFTVPTVPAGTLPCGDVVGSNLTVSFVGATSLDGASICVRVP